jgi:hypothetical protein
MGNVWHGRGYPYTRAAAFSATPILTFLTSPPWLMTNGPSGIRIAAVPFSNEG